MTDTVVHGGRELVKLLLQPFTTVTRQLPELLMEVPCSHFSHLTLNGLQEGIVNEDILSLKTFRGESIVAISSFSLKVWLCIFAVMTHLICNHKAPPLVHALYVVKDVHVALSPDPLQLCEDSNEDPGPPCTRTAVDHHGTTAKGILLHHFMDKVQELCRAFRNTTVRPDSEVELFDDLLLFGVVLLERDGSNGVAC